MEKRRLGKSNISIAPLVFGGNVFGWTADEPTSFNLLDAFVDAGLDCIDTADVYSTWVPGHQGGESETIIGNWLKKSGKRDKVIIATKVGSKMSENRKGLSKKYIIEEVEDSLKRLKTDYIDLYQSHRDDASTPIQETLEAYDQLVKQGKIRAIGASNFTAQRLQESLQISAANNLPAYVSIQPEYNVYDREDYEKELEALCLKEDIGVITYYSLASGFLTGKYRSEADLKKSQRGKGIQKYLNTRGFNILKALDEVSEKHKVTPAAIALAWVIARPGITAPIASATSIEQLEQLTKAVTIKLMPEDIDMINNASKYQ